MTQTHGTHLRPDKRCQSEYRHRIGIVEHPGLWAELLGIVKDIEPGRTGAQCLEDTARTNGIANTLIDPMLHGQIKVMAHIGETGNFDAIDNKIAPGQQVTSLS